MMQKVFSKIYPVILLVLLFCVVYLSRTEWDKAWIHPNRTIKETKRAHRLATQTPLNTSITYDNCVLNGSFQDNFRRVENYPEGTADQYYDLIGANLEKPRVMSSFPVFATAANSVYYKLLGKSLRTLHELILPHYKDAKIIFYDIGLTPEQLENVKTGNFCKCEIRRFPFEKFPVHVSRLKGYAWKPLIVQTLLMEYGFVWWMDTSIRFTKSNLTSTLAYARQNHIWFFTHDPWLSLAYNTNQRTWDFFGEPACAYIPFGEIDASTVLFYYDNVTKVVVRKWAACALNEDCMTPKKVKLTKCIKTNETIGRCHRFDQSALGIILRRLYHEQNYYPTTGKAYDVHIKSRVGKY